MFYDELVTAKLVEIFEFVATKMQKTNFLSVYRLEKIREVWRWIYRDQNV